MLTISSPFEHIPPEWHLPGLILTALVGFLLILGFSKGSAFKNHAQPQSTPVTVKSEPIEEDYKATGTGNEEEEAEEKELPPRTPGTKGGRIKKSSPSSPARTPTIKANTYGSVATPIGRRSARVAARSAQKA